MNRRAAFTLVEMLLVVALIALLISILLPSLTRSREISRRAVCGSNMHQFSTALDEYVIASRRRYPGGNASLIPGNGIDSTYAVSSQTPMGLAVLITEKFLNSPLLLYCPSWTHPWNQYNVVDVAGNDPWFGPSMMGGWPAPGSSGPTRHRGISYHYRSTFGVSFNRPPSHVHTRPANAIAADHWVQREVLYGNTYGHREGYNTLALDGRVFWKSDMQSAYMLSVQPPGMGLTNGSWAFQEIIWKQFFDQ